MFTLGKNERLKSKKIIADLFKSGKSFTVHPFRVHYLTLTQESFILQAGVSVSARNFKKAVDRNRIKRLMREAYRLQKQALTEAVAGKKIALAIFLVYTAKEFPDYPQVHQKMGTVIQKLTGKLNEKGAPDT